MAKNASTNIDNDVKNEHMLMDEVKISVRGMVEFILRSGDIDNRKQRTSDSAMQEGSRIHRMIQKSMGSDYQAEVPLKYTLLTPKYKLIVDGRADGIIDRDGDITIDEIKGTYRDVERMKKPSEVHVAQAKCYAYMYGVNRNAKSINIRMTYCNIETEDIRYFYEEYAFEELEQWFLDLVGAYKKWADEDYNWKQIRTGAIKELNFPFEYRKGQKELVTYTYQTIYHGKKLFIEAPTGVGKTLSTVFPAVKAMGEGFSNKIFYLTAKTITRTVAEEAFILLRNNGLRFKSIVLTAKDKICFLDKPDCNPEKCQYAKGHYDRINDAVFDLMCSGENFSREIIEEYAIKYQVCPFELCLDLSLFADGIICDYNYLFDPHVYLKRFFGDGVKGDYIFLIDEAHNLLERGREMYSAPIIKEKFLELKQEIKETMMSQNVEKARKNQVSGQMTLGMTDDKEIKFTINNDNILSENDDGNIEAINNVYVDENSNEATQRSSNYQSVLIKKGHGEKIEYWLDKCNKELLRLKRKCDAPYVLVEGIDPFVKVLLKLYNTIDEYLDEQEEYKLPIRDMLLDFFFEIAHFLDVYEELDSNYVKYTQICENGDFLLKLFCVNPSEKLKGCMLRGRSSILFSATLLPIQYYKKLLGGEESDYEVYAKSIFDQKKRALFIANDVTSKYSRRTPEEFERIARHIMEITTVRGGNYMVFCPSYSFMRSLYEIYTANYEFLEQNCIIQTEYMNEKDRENFLELFEQNVTSNDTLIAFCVLGGIFSEGIDLKKDMLIGAIIVGTGIPLVCNEREILKNYFDEEGESGYDYAYKYPGMNKVLQAAGRVIRTVDDVGVVALLDERFMQASYRRMFPREWENVEYVDVNRVGFLVENFWNFFK